MSSTATAAVQAPPQRRLVYVGLSGLMASIAVWGFWPTYFGPLVVGALAQPLLIHIHAGVFIGWLFLFFLQAYFAATKRIRWHLRVGKIGVWYGVVLILVGVTTSIVRSSHLARDGTAESLLYRSLADMVMFGGFFGAAIWYRNRPHLHRRWMVVAATTLLVAAVGRLTVLPPAPWRIPTGLMIWSAPMLVAMVHEWRKTRTVHPIFLLGLGVFILRRYSVPLSQTATWGEFANAVFTVTGLK